MQLSRLGNYMYNLTFKFNQSASSNFQVFTRFQKLMITVSHRTTISTMDNLADGHDEEVFEWRDSLKEALPKPSEDEVSISLSMVIWVK